jgi:hypothetical protein
MYHDSVKRVKQVMQGCLRDKGRSSGCNQRADLVLYGILIPIKKKALSMEGIFLEYLT